MDTQRQDELAYEQTGDLYSHLQAQSIELAKLREENQRLRAMGGEFWVPRGHLRQAKIEVLREVIAEDVNWNPPLEIIIERKLEQLEGE